MPKLKIPYDIDERIVRLAEQNPKLTPTAIVRDIARIQCIFNLLDQGLLNDDTVVCGGMALRCFGSTRLSIYDADTSTRIDIGVAELAEALGFESPDLVLRPVDSPDWKNENEILTAAPIEFEPDFTQLRIVDNTFSLSVASRGLERPAEWRPFISGYPFDLGCDGVELPVMALNEMLAEKIVSWWLFGHAKHYADLAFIAALLKNSGFVGNADEREDILDLIEKKIATNQKLHPGRVKKLTPDERIRRLEDPEKNINPERNWETVSYIGKGFSPIAMKGAVTKALIPFLFLDGSAS